MKRILLIADARGWVFERHCNEIKKRITEYEFDIVFTWNSNPAEYDYSKYDLVYQLDPMGIGGLNPPKEKTIMGLRNEFMYKHDLNGINHFYIHEIERKCCMLHVVNKNQLKHFSQVAKIPLLLTQHGVDTDIFKPVNKKQPGKQLVIGTSGNATSGGGKGFDLVERASALTGCHLRISRQNLGGGHLSKEQMVVYYNDIDVYCSMSQTEGLNNCIMEAGACGVPVITTRTGAVDEIIVDGVNGFVIPRDVDSLIRKIKSFQLVSTTITAFGNNLQETITKNWSWNVKIEDFRRMFSRFFEDHP
jgi:hypothetical protein